MGAARWLERLGNLRNIVRQEMVARQLARHLPSAGTVLDVGAGQGTQVLICARRGLQVTAVEPDERMRRAMAGLLADEPASVRERIVVVEGRVGHLAETVGDRTFDAVLCHGVLMYLPESGPAVADLATHCAPGGLVSIVQRNGDAMAWRPAMRGDWAATLAMLDGLERAREAGRSPLYRNEIGSDARADTVDRLHGICRASGLTVEQWYGVRVVSDAVDVETKPPAADELAALLDVEDRLGCTDPYRRVATLQHVIARRDRR